MNEELSVHDMSVSINDAGKIVVHGSGKPDGATVTVTVSLTGGGTASNSGEVVSGAWQIEVNLQGSVGATGEVEAVIGDEDFSEDAVGYYKFELK